MSDITYDYEKEQLRDQVDNFEEEQRHRWATQRKEREERAYWANRTASTWAEALQKQARLHQAENQAMVAELGEDVDDPWFAEMAEACTEALPIYELCANNVQDQIDDLRKQIAALKEIARLEAAAAIDDDVVGSAHNIVADALRRIADDDEKQLSEWLLW